ncbi:hypothetical protein E0H50_05330 [Kribbella sindirgiensis]|uniref:Uncharacterized protein n=1 Tax=Kribbella sindirgiensis TaxID=1124744 RepID=A0A4R0J3A3_9ACTN|nr:hypothetical protein E0H50_05330 [Kribbella sindirgiensis]
MVIPDFTASGLLPPGLHRASWSELCAGLGWNARRQSLLEGLGRAALNLRQAGAVAMWVDGSFATGEEDPNDWDAAWDPMPADLNQVDPILLDSSPDGRLRQKAKYGGELFAQIEGKTGFPFQLFFQQTRDGEAKGIVLLNLRTVAQ